MEDSVRQVWSIDGAVLGIYMMEDRACIMADRGDQLC